MKTRISIVVAMLNEAEGLNNLRRKIFETIAAIPELEPELILVDDGSTDSSWKIIKGFCAEDPRIRGVRLSRNFGNHAALLAGLRVASGEVAMNLAADLQTPTELISRFFYEYQKGAEVIFGARRQRADSPWDQFCARIFYRTINLLTSQRMPMGGIDVFMVNRKVMEELLQLHGRNTSILGLIMNLGFDQRVIEYDRPARLQGKSKWTLKKKLALFADGIFAFSGAPLRLCFPVGGVLTASGLIMFWAAFLDSGTMINIWHLLSLATVVVGFQFFGVGLVGEYLYRVFQETQQHPVFVVREDTGKDGKGKSA